MVDPAGLKVYVNGLYGDAGRIGLKGPGEITGSLQAGFLDHVRREGTGVDIRG
ncbi:MAG: hypothetical protein ACM3WT_00790 [Bacillota bacterium]